MNDTSEVLSYSRDSWEIVKQEESMGV